MSSITLTSEQLTNYTISIVDITAIKFNRFLKGQPNTTCPTCGAEFCAPPGTCFCLECGKPLNVNPEEVNALGQVS